MKLNCLFQKLYFPILFFVLILGHLLLGCESKRILHIEEGTKKVNGVDLYYKAMGEGEPIVILHGGPGLNHTYLLPQMAKLADDFKLIFFDQRACGASSGDVDPSSMTLENFVKDVEGIRSAFNLNKMNLIGHSWGGLLALFYAIQYPDNLKSLILMNPAAATSEFWKTLVAKINSKRTPTDSLALAQLSASEGFKNMKPDALQKYFKISYRAFFYNQSLGDSLNLKVNEKTAMNIFSVNSLLHKNTLSNYDIHDKLSIINCPSLIIHGDSDPIQLEYIKRINESIRNSHFVLLEKCGHFPYIESKEKLFNVIKDFLKSLPN